MRALRVNETKVSSRNAFIEIFFSLELEKESKNDKGYFFGDNPLIFDLHVKP